MPICRIGGKLVLFAHVPRCAGSSVEDFLAANFGPLGFLDRKFRSPRRKAPWSLSSPQHIPAAELQSLMPAMIFDTGFAIVRHPVTRLLSVFHFQRDVERSLPGELDFPDWLAGLGAARHAAPHYLDNHPRPMTEMVPSWANIFQLEGGLAPVTDWLADLAGAPLKEPGIQHLNSLAGRAPGHASPKARDLSQSTRDLIARLYRPDFDRFGYDPEEVP